jgi:O-antigen/teichoic acid export membrane protein
MFNKLKPKSEFSRNVLTLMTGTTIAQAIPIAISPILTRIYTPEDFGVFALFLAITSIFGSIASGKYELAIMLPKKDEDAINIFALGFIITSLISFILLFLVILFGNYIVIILGNDEIKLWLYFVPVTVFFIGIFNILNYFNNRKKNYTDLRKATILKSIVFASIQLSIGFIKQGATGLITGQILSHIFANMQLLKNIIKDKVLISKISKPKIIALAKKYKDFFKFSMPSTLLSTIASQVPILLLSNFFNATIVGFYSLSHKLISMPIFIIGSSIGQVFFQKSSVLKEDKEALKILTLNTYKTLFKIGIIPFSILAVFADYIFGFIFGKEWIIAGEYAQVLSIWILFVFISSPISNLTSILEKQKEALYFSIFLLIVRVLVILFGALILNNAYQTIVLHGVVGFILLFSWSMYLLKLASVDIFEVLIFTFKYIILSIGLLSIIRNYFC